MCGPSLRKVGQGVFELLIRKKVIDGLTYRQNDMCKAICPLFFEVGHKNDYLLKVLKVCSSYITVAVSSLQSFLLIWQL